MSLIVFPATTFRASHSAVCLYWTRSRTLEKYANFIILNGRKEEKISDFFSLN